MANHLHTLLKNWQPRRDECAWVLGTVVETQGSSYRKAGAMMLFNELGEYFGLLSGGCLEKALFTDVKKVLNLGSARIVEFDSTGDTDVAWQLGLGCGGKVKILLQPVTAENNYQQLLLVLDALELRKSVGYVINTEVSNLAAINDLVAQKQSTDIRPHQLMVPLAPVRHIAIFGGGVDAVPLAQMAKTLGWQVSLVDQRVGYAQAQHFSSVDYILRSSAEQSEVTALLQTVDAAFVMTHNVQLDANALAALLPTQVCYIGLLGPVHRKKRVLIKAGLTDDPRIQGPMGLELGGELPESIALAALAQCHQRLETAQNRLTATKLAEKVG